MDKFIARALALFIISVVGQLHAQELKPLLMEGKKTLYQRVLSIPDARVYELPDSNSASEEIVPFSVLYVYRKQQGWIQVGYDSFGKTAGWVSEKQAIVWN